MNAASQRALLIGTVLALPLALVHGLSVLDPGWSRSRLRVPELSVLDLDYRVRAAVRRPPTPDSLRLIVEDDRTRARTGGEFPSEWGFLNALVERIAAQKPRAIFLDYSFDMTELVERLGLEVESVRTDARARGLDLGPLDQRLATVEASLRLKSVMLSTLGKGRVILPMVCAVRDSPVGSAPLDPVVASKVPPLDGDAPGAHDCTRFDAPEPALAAIATSIALDDFALDADGVLRREQMLLRTAGDGGTRLVPGIAPVLAAWALGASADSLRLDDAGLHVGTRTVPVADDGSALIDFRGGPGSFQRLSRQGHPLTYSAETLLDGSIPPGTLTDRVVLVGDARSTTTDVHATPFDHQQTLPGVEAIALATATILEEPYPLRRPAAADTAGFLLTVLLWAAGVWAGVSLPMRWSLPLAVAVPALVLAGGAAAFAGAGLWVDTAYPAGSWAIALLGAAITRNRIEDAERGFLHDAFTKYLSPKQVEAMLRDPTLLRLHGVEREMTILFADLRGFTSRTERLAANEMVALLNEHLTAMSQVIAANEGIVDKYVGDCVMAFWGAPIDDPQHALHACRAGLEMHQTLARENARRAAQGREQLAIGVGICSGKVIVGNMGSQLKFDYTVIGDAVNLASRFEGLTKETGYGVLIGERTRDLLANALPTDEIGPMKIKGKAEAVRVFGLRASRYGVAEGDAAGVASSDARSSRPA